MRALVFLDLDDTLFQTRHKCPVDAELHPAAYLKDGTAHSFMTGGQRALWRLLEPNATLIPTTARDLDALRRVDLPFRSWSIIDYGGVILDPQGTPDPEWMERMRAVSQAAIGDLLALLDTVDGFIAQQRLAAKVRIIEDLGLPFYLVAKYRDGHSAHLDRIQQDLVAPWVAERAADFRLHRNGNNLAVIPRALGKEWAVRYLIGRLARDWGEVVTIGVGDSLIDGDFMAECDYSMTPRGSQLFEAAFRPAFL